MNAEKLNLWDRIFNRYRTEIHQEGREIWEKYTFSGDRVKVNRCFVTYKKIDRLTGGVTLKKVYLN